MLGVITGLGPRGGYGCVGVGSEVYEAADAVLEVLARRLGEEDLERLAVLLDRLPLLVRLLEALDEETVESLVRLLGLARRLGGVAGCLGEALEREPVKVEGLRGLLGLLRDEEVMRGLGRAVEILRSLGRCEG